METDLNPFVYSRPIAPDEVIDRDAETAKLLALAAGGHFVRLYAPRKYGKTSLLRRVLRDAERDEGMVPLLVDLYGVLSLADVAIGVKLQLERRVDPLPALHALLDLPLRLAADGDRRALVVFDEFQD